MIFKPAIILFLVFSCKIIYFLIIRNPANLLAAGQVFFPWPMRSFNIKNDGGRA
jgi:hypothetical protein